jgi:hypothetical protein
MSCVYENNRLMGDCSTCVGIENAFINAKVPQKYFPLTYQKPCVDLYKPDDYSSSCYGAPYIKRCATCGDVINAYKNNNWWLDVRQFAHCQGILNGSYAQSCKDTNFNNETMTSTCRNGRGGWVNNSIDLRNCNGALWNNNGRLSC